MTILITGAAGFIGSNLCEKLLKDGHEIIGVDNLITGDKTNLKNLFTNSQFSFFEMDITETSFLERINAVQNIDQIYHLACPTGVPNIGPMSEEMLLTCSVGTKNVLEIARSHQAKFLFTSSSEVYGDPLIFPQSESYTGNVDPTGYRSPYEEGKRFSESLVEMYFKKYKVDAKMVRLFNGYGPKMSAKETRVIPVFLRQAKENKAIPIKGDGLNKRTFLYIEDLMKGLIMVMENGLGGEVYNLGSDREVSIKDLAEIVIELTNSSSQVEHLAGDSHDHKRRMPDLSKIKNLGWEQKIELKEGILQMLDQSSYQPLPQEYVKEAPQFV